LYDEHNVAYLDTRNNVAHCGHAHPRIVHAIQQQVAQLNTNTRYLHPTMALVAEKLVRTMPRSHAYKVFFVNSGSEANDLALRLARAASSHKHICVLEHAYHGATLGTVQISPYKYQQGSEYIHHSPGPHIHALPAPTPRHGESSPVALTRAVTAVQQYCHTLQEEHNEGLQAMVVEPGMSVAGVHLVPRTYLQLVQTAVHQAGGVVIVDEVQTGLGRIGTHFWAWQHAEPDWIPDIVTVGKPLGNGMPIAAVIVLQSIVERFEACGVEYFNTFGGNPVCAAAALEVLCVVEEEDLQHHALRVGTYLQTRLKRLQQQLAMIGDVRGSGLFLGIELVRDTETWEPATAETSFLCSILKSKYHILTSIDGPLENVLVLKPPMVFSEQDADRFLECFTLALTTDLTEAGDAIHRTTRTPT
jgi:4-aminobutyrate aminotransferase-like enzyme